MIRRRHRCPVCGHEDALTLRTGAGGLFVLCAANACARDAILAALERQEAER